MLVFAGLFSRRLRWLAVTFLIYGAVFLLASSGWVIEDSSHSCLISRGESSLVHNPGRLSYAVPFALAIVAALGIDASREEAVDAFGILMIVPGVVDLRYFPTSCSERIYERMRLDPLSRRSEGPIYLFPIQSPTPRCPWSPTSTLSTMRWRA